MENFMTVSITKNSKGIILKGYKLWDFGKKYVQKKFSMDEETASLIYDAVQDYQKAFKVLPKPSVIQELVDTIIDFRNKEDKDE